METVFRGGNEFSARFHQVLRFLAQLSQLRSESSKREWESGVWPYNSECVETMTSFFEGEDRVVVARAQRELCHGTLDDDDLFEICVLESNSELVAQVAKIWR